MPGSGWVAEPGFELCRAGEGRDQDSARLGLPPGVDDRAAAVADHSPVPFPGLGIDRLADGAEQPDRLATVALHRLVAFAHQGADRGRCRVEDGDAEPVHRLPEPAEVGIVGDAVEHDGRRAIHQRPVDDIGVAGDPADVGGAPEDVVLAIIEDPVEGRGGPDGIAAGRVDDALRFARRSGRVEDEQRVFRVHRLRLAIGRKLVAHGGVADVAALLHRHVGSGPGDDDHGLDVAVLERLVDVALQRNVLAAADAFVRGDDRAGVAVGDAAGEALRREAAEDDGVDRTDARAGEHCGRRFRDHRHVDHDPAAAMDAALLQQVREAAGFLVQLAIGVAMAVPRLVGLEDDGRPVAMLLEVSVEAIDGQVQLTVGVPADVEIVFVEGPVARLLRGLVPVKPPGLFQPEGIRIGVSLRPQRLQLVRPDPRPEAFRERDEPTALTGRGSCRSRSGSGRRS